MVLPFISNKLDYSHSISRIPISSLLLFDKYPSRHSMRISHMPNNHRKRERRITHWIIGW